GAEGQLYMGAFAASGIALAWGDMSSWLLLPLMLLAGFAAGLYLGYRLVTSLSVNLAGWDWLVVVIGGVIGSLLILSVFEWALILLSSLIGASLITQVSLQATHLQTAPRMIIFAVLVLVGVFIQSAQKQRDPV
ncbi:MAG: hypothetical protein AAGU05_14915, partial [Anaerolineaceae bacterium]